MLKCDIHLPLPIQLCSLEVINFKISKKKKKMVMVINISCKLEKASYNIFFVRAVMVKSLYTLRLSSGYNDLLNSENLKVAIAQLCHDIEVCNFTVL